jgi:Transglutaminase-like superfamily
MADYMLANHVCWCAVEDGVVFLDIKKHKYVGINRHFSDLLYGIVQNSFSASISPPANCDAAEADALSALLATEGLVTRDAALGKPLLPLSVETVGAIDSPRRTPLDTQLLGIHLFKLMFSFITVKYQLRMVPFEKIVRRAQARQPERPTAIVLSGDQVARLVRLFRRLRSFFYTAHNNCLLDSLVLRDFLYRNGITSTWVMAVESRPFAAHSWIQYRGIVLNDSLEHVQRYTPIFSV